MMFYHKVLLMSMYLSIENLSAYINEGLADIDIDYDNFLPTNSTPNGTYQILKELSNATRSAGDTVQFLCEVKILDSNATEKITVKWYRNLDSLSSGRNVKILTTKEGPTRLSSTLTMGDLAVEDGGSYGCVFARRGVQPLESRAYLDVSARNMTSLNQVTEAGGARAATADETRPFRADEPFCQSYGGTTCQLYLGSHDVFVQPPHAQRDIEENLRAAYLVISQSNDISVECSKFVLPSLCYSAFPLCHDAGRIRQQQQSRLFQTLNETSIVRNQLSVYLRRICKDECVILETELCNREYAIAKRHPIISKVLDLEECEHLPNAGAAAASSPGCLKLGIDGRQIDERETCFWGKGADYRGVHDAARNGDKCKRWAHQFQVPLSKHPELLGHSYCRNPGELEAEPFCYTDQTKREPCGLRRCSNLVMICVVAALALVVLIGAAVSWVYCFRRRGKTRNIQNINVPAADKNIYGNGGPSSPIELNTLLLPPSSSNRTANKNCFQNIPNYTYKEVNFVEELGEGAFGKVYKGELRTKGGKSFVAVKSLKENASAKTQADFQREIELISELKHPNIICLLGIVIKQEPMCMLFEYMSEGDLHEFLIGNSPNNGKSLTQTQFLHVAIQIAQGMEYLSDNHYVHRDLAARNCLVSKDLVVKISDFGLSRDMYSCDYYRVQSKSLLPVRWMPPESILYGKFTTESDVWSYGVVLWEIYSYGLQPYYGYNNQEVINMIRSRKLLPCPDACPSYCYSLMVECWAELAIRRPSFGEISHRLRVWKQAGSQTGAYFKPPDVVTVPQKPGHCSKSSLSMEAPPVCPVFENRGDPSLTWERNLKRATAAKLSESQSSLMSRASAADQGKGSKRSVDRRSQKGFAMEGSLDRTNPKNVIVSSNGENSIQSKLT